jgi:hypothetical protein
LLGGQTLANERHDHPFLEACNELDQLAVGTITREYCSLNDSEEFCELNSHATTGPAWAQGEIAHFAFHPARTSLAATGNDSLWEDFIQHRRIEHLPLPRGE